MLVTSPCLICQAVSPRQPRHLQIITPRCHTNHTNVCWISHTLATNQPIRAQNQVQLTNQEPVTCHVTAGTAEMNLILTDINMICVTDMSHKYFTLYEPNMKTVFIQPSLVSVHFAQTIVGLKMVHRLAVLWTNRFLTSVINYSTLIHENNTHHFYR